MAEFRRTLAIAPGTGIVNLAGNALSGMGVALLDLGRVDEAIPFLQAALSIRTEIDDLEHQAGEGGRRTSGPALKSAAEWHGLQRG